jgi:predicted amidophosphoribosyltransferase
MKLQAGYITDFISLLFPELCQACGVSLITGEELICTDCLYHLPFTDFHLKPHNMVARQFWGKINLEAAYAMCYFTKGGKMQHLRHQFKYKGVQKTGNLPGNIAGGQLAASPAFNSADLIIPRPFAQTQAPEKRL